MVRWGMFRGMEMEKWLKKVRINCTLREIFLINCLISVVCYQGELKIPLMEKYIFKAVLIHIVVSSSTVPCE